MQYRRILVLGCCGSGKSTFARRLGALAGLPVVHLDALFWKPGWVQATREEFIPVLQDALSKDSWIIDGNYAGTLPLRLSYCDLVVYFDFPRWACLRGVFTRVLRTHGRVRPDMGDGCPERLDWDFIKYTWNFEKTQGAENRALVRGSGKPAVWFRSRRDARRYLTEIQECFINK
jgi:adenylate kinase family enzyme